MFSRRRKWQPHSAILAWRIPWTEEPGRLLSMGLQELDKTERLSAQQYVLVNATGPFGELFPILLFAYIASPIFVAEGHS